MPLARMRQAEHVALDREIGRWGNDVDVVALERHTLRCLLHCHSRMAGQEVDHHALVRGIEMLNEDERHAVADGERVHQFANRDEPPRGCSDSDDREILAFGRLGSFRADTPARRRSRCAQATHAAFRSHSSPRACIFLK